jgi:AraC family transcriptional regulator
MLRRVLAYIEDNLSEDLSLSAISAVAGLSASHCQRTFHNAVGLSVHRYVIQRRVERAKHLLADKRLPISEVAFAVGFSHQSHLACHMQRLLGVSPAGVRKASE